MIHHIEQTSSTNDDARRAEYTHGDVIWAEEQRAGRGQRGHAWSSPRGENLTFSVVLQPTFLPVTEQFLLSEAVALALTDTFAHYAIDARIKWTNDIYVGDRKLVGILIEHNYAGQQLSRTIAGVGINVNQGAFDPLLPNPVSMTQLTGLQYDRSEVLNCFCEQLAARYAQLERGEKERLQADYIARMYRLNERHPFRTPDGTLTYAAIRGVRASGELILRHDDGAEKEYLFKEVEFVLKK
ncbi:MAG: biotin--[acetyl-CoA-carboxylase] ligase [Alistipes sp.]